MELPFGFIMDFAYDPSGVSFDSIPQYLELFAGREFGSQYAKDIAAVLMEYSRLVARRRFESITPTTYSYFEHHELETVLDDWIKLAQTTIDVASTLPEEYQTAFWHLAGYPVAAGANYHKTVLGQARNRVYAVQRRNTANLVAKEVLQYFEDDFDLGEKYDTIADGKWKGMMSQPKFDSGVSADFRQTSRDVLANLSYVQLRQNSNYELGPLGIYAEGNDNLLLEGLLAASIDPTAPTLGHWSPVLPPITRYGPQSRTAEIYHRGDERVAVNWTVSNEYDWLNISPLHGQISSSVPQQVLDVSVDWSRVPAGYNDTVNVTVTWDARPYFDLLHIPVQNVEVPQDFHGFPESSGLISIEAPHFQRQSATPNSTLGFTAISFLGTRSDSGVIAIRPYAAARQSPAESCSTYVEYQIYLFEDSPAMNATLYVTAGLDTDPTLPMRYSLSLDNATASPVRVLEEPKLPGDLPESWLGEVANSVWTRNVTLGPVSKGSHILRWSVNSPELYLEKIVLATRKPLGKSYLGPPETLRV